MIRCFVCKGREPGVTAPRGVPYVAHQSGDGPSPVNASRSARSLQSWPLQFQSATLPIVQTFGDKLRQAREKAGFSSTYALHEAAKVNQGDISSYENGGKLPSIRTFFKLTNALGLSKGCKCEACVLGRLSLKFVKR